MIDYLLTTAQYKTGPYGDILNIEEVNRWLMQRHAHLPFHQACSSTSVTPQEIEVCFEEHGIELANQG